MFVGASKNLTLLIIFWGTTNQAIEQKISQHGKRNKNEINKDVFLSKKIAEEKKRKWKTSKHPPKTQIVKESAEI